MSDAISIRTADLPRDMGDIERLCWAYRAHLATLGAEVVAAIDYFYPTQTYGELIANLPEKHARPKGSILLAWQGDRAIGCGMIQPLSDADAEIKRVFVEDTAQGVGAGKTLSRALIAQAEKDGYNRILLDTTHYSVSARRLYEKLGFVARGPYSDVPDEFLDLLLFYELRL